MKKASICLIIIILFSGCGNDFLDLTPDSVMNAGLFYKNQKDFEQAVIATYDALQSGGEYGGDFRTVMELRSDNATSGGNSSAARINLFLEVPTDDVLLNVWGELYQGIARSNMVLDRIKGVSMDETIKMQYQAEARFIRALSYFNLVRLWGAVPLVMSIISPEDALGYKRQEVSKVYAVIEEDLLFSLQHLPENYSEANLGRATSTAASALLGKVYLTQKKYTKAVEVLKQILGKNSLLPDIRDVFSTDNEMNDEIIFAVRWLKGNEGTGLFYSVNETSTLIEPSLMNAYPAGDARKPLLELQTVSGTIKVPRKFFDTFSANNNVGTDFPVLRYADVLLMYAEALNEESYSANGEAFQYLNAIRGRAGVATYDATSLPDQNTFRKAVWNERRLELALECDRWFDLIRTGTAIEAMQVVGLNIEAYQLLYPVPQSEIDLINNTSVFYQNPGYK